MGSWNEILHETKAAGSVHDVIRRKYLEQLQAVTGRNVIVYYSGWLQKGQLNQAGYRGFRIYDSDKNGFMACIHKLDRTKGLDLILHTPGGETSATESIVDYLRTMFGTDIRAIVPQLAMSAGTMIALSCKEIIMGKHSNLGPIDPQLGGVAAHGVIEEFERAKAEIKADQKMALVWQPIIAKYSPTFIGDCEKAIKMSEQVTLDWLESGMFKGDADPKGKAKKVVDELASHSLTKAHDRHISIKKAEELGLKIVPLEGDAKLQDAVLSVHHAYIQTLTETPATKIIENHLGVAFIDAVQSVVVAR